MQQFARRTEPDPARFARFQTRFFGHTHGVDTLAEHYGNWVSDTARATGVSPTELIAGFLIREAELNGFNRRAASAKWGSISSWPESVTLALAKIPKGGFRRKAGRPPADPYAALVCAITYVKFIQPTATRPGCRKEDAKARAARLLGTTPTVVEKSLKRAWRHLFLTTSVRGDDAETRLRRAAEAFAGLIEEFENVAQEVFKEIEAEKAETNKKRRDERFGRISAEKSDEG